MYSLYIIHFLVLGFEEYHIALFSWLAPNVVIKHTKSSEGQLISVHPCFGTLALPVVYVTFVPNLLYYEVRMEQK